MSHVTRMGLVIMRLRIIGLRWGAIEQPETARLVWIHNRLRLMARKGLLGAATWREKGGYGA